MYDKRQQADEDEDRPATRLRDAQNTLILNTTDIIMHERLYQK